MLKRGSKYGDFQPWHGWKVQEMGPTSHPGHVPRSAKPAWPGRLAGVSDPEHNAEEHFIHVEKAGAVIDALKTADPTNKEAKREFYGSAVEDYPAASPTSTEEKE